VEVEDKMLAEGVMRRLCQGAQIDGIRFGPILQLLITDHGSGKAPIRGQVYFNLASTWAVFDLAPASFPDNEKALPEPPVEEQLQTLCSLRERVITEIRLGEDQPHLILSLDDGRILFVNGRHEQYECWQLGAAFGNPGEFYMVVALPGGGGVAVWAPENFDPGSA
jgi:hypothetical protein